MNTIFLTMFSIVVMLLLTLPRAKMYSLSIKQAVAMTFYVFVTGIFGTMIVFYIENGVWGGTSFFGAVFLIPLSILVLSVFLNELPEKLTDLVAPSGLAMYVVNKLNCLVSGCCGGKIVGYTHKGVPIFFPSQIIEMVTVTLIVGIALILERKEAFKGRIYPICLVIYGVSRYFLNTYRMEQAEFVFGMPPGNFWSVCAVVIGIVWCLLSWISKKRR